jgi:hypothetical protein
MDRADRYRRKAAECLEAARLFSRPEQRASIVAVADAFTRLADFVDEYRTKLPRLTRRSPSRRPAEKEGA